MQHNISDYHKMTTQERDSIFKFNDFNYEYFWFNSSQINRLNNEGYFSVITRNDKNYKVLNIDRDRETNELSVIHVKHNYKHGVDPKSEIYIIW